MKTNLFYHVLAIVFLSAGLMFCDAPKKENKKEQTHSEQTKPAAVKKGNQRQEPTIIKDDRGNIIERQSYSYRKDNSIRSRDSYYYEYDDNNNLIKDIKESYDLEDRLIYKNINYHTFNKKNELIKTIFESYDGDNKLQQKAHSEFVYNEKGYKIEDLSFYEDGTLKGKIILDPDESGALRSEEYINYNPDGSKKDHKKYYYNQYGLEKTVDLMEKAKGK